MDTAPKLGDDGWYGYEDAKSFNRFENPNQISWLQEQIVPLKETPTKFIIDVKHMEYKVELTRSSVYQELPLICLFLLLVSRMDKDFGISRQAAMDHFYLDPEACFALYREWIGDEMETALVTSRNVPKILKDMLKMIKKAKKTKLSDDWQTKYKAKFKQKFAENDNQKLVRILFQAYLGLYLVPRKKGSEDTRTFYNIGRLYNDAIDKAFVPANVKKAINFVDINRERVFEDEFMDDFYWALDECFPNTYKALKRIGVKEIDIPDKMKCEEAKKVFKILQARKHLELKEIQYRDAKAGNSSTAKFLLKNMDEEMMKKKILKGQTEDDDVDNQEDSLPDYLQDAIPESPVKLETNLKGIHADLGTDRE